MSRALVVVVLACLVCIPFPRRSAPDAALPATGAVVGQVFRAGAPTAATVSVHRLLALDPRDPFAAFRGMKRFDAWLRPAAGTHDAVMMVESEAKELPEKQMLEAVMFGHKHFQPVIQAIIKLAETAAKEPWDIKLPDFD